MPVVKTPPDTPPPTPKNDPTPVVRVDVPSDDKIKEITASVRDTYKDDYAKKPNYNAKSEATKAVSRAAESAPPAKQGVSQ